MSFNQTIFNRGPFNLSDSANATWFDIEAMETVDAVTSVSKDVYLLCIPHEGIGISIHGENFKNFSVNAHEVLGYNVALEGTYWMDVQFDEKMDTTIKLSVEFRPYLELFETHDCKAEIKYSRHIWVSAEETVDEETTVFCEYHTVFDGNELVSQVADLVVVEEIACVLNLTLQPGERLIVDANNYNVLVDDQNMIYTQEGEWLDELTRDTYSITVTAASGGAGLEAKILYTERYL